MTKQDYISIQISTHLKIASAAISEAQAYGVNDLKKPLQLLQLLQTQIAGVKLKVPEVKINES